MQNDAKKTGALHLTMDDFDQTLEKAGEMPVLVDFFAEWCGPCRMVAPVIEELAEEMQGKAVVAKVDVDENNELAQKFGVMSIPTLLVFKKGKVVEQQTGLANKEKFAEMLNKHMPKAKN